MERCNLPLEQSSITIAHANNTLIVSVSIHLYGNLIMICLEDRTKHFVILGIFEAKAKKKKKKKKT